MVDTPLIRLTGLFENKSQRTGDTYFSGYLGGAKLLMLRDKHAEPGKPQWALLIAERPQQQDRQTQPSGPPLGSSPRRAETEPIPPRVQRAPAPPKAAPVERPPLNDEIPF